jgi:hypothetical protein
VSEPIQPALTPEEWVKVDEGHLQELLCGGRYRTYVESGDLYSVDGAFNMDERDRYADPRPIYTQHGLLNPSGTPRRAYRWLLEHRSSL